MSDEDRGQVDTSAAEVYDSLFVPALFGRFADAIVDAAQIERTDHVVDVACGSARPDTSSSKPYDGPGSGPAPHLLHPDGCIFGMAAKVADLDTTSAAPGWG